MKKVSQPQLLPFASQQKAQLSACYQKLQDLPRPHRRRLQRQFKTTLGGVALALVLGHSPEAMATTINVTTTDPAISVDGNCSLKEAIINANTDIAAHEDCAPGSGADIIVLSGGIYSLTTVDNGLFIDTNGTDTNGLPLITSAITIQGNGATIERTATATDDFRLFRILPSGELTLENTTVSGGSGVTRGGGIYNEGSVTLTNSTISGNSANSSGGLFNTGIATLTQSTVRDNSAFAFGGGLQNKYGTTILTNSTVNDNFANFGAGIYNDNGTAILTNSTVSGNFAAFGGGLFNNDGSATLINSTVSLNYAIESGGGLYNSGTATLTQSIVSGNSAASKAYEIYDPFASITADAQNIFGYIGQSNAQAFAGFNPGATDITATSDGNTPTDFASILYPVLADNGGPTQTHALVAGSPALDTIPEASCNLIQDQRGEPRPVDGGTGVANCDSGAFELNVCGATYTLPGNEWHQISLPCAPPAGSNTPATVFGDDVMGTYGSNWVLWSYNPATNSYDNPGPNGTLQQGVGYWMIYLGAGSATLDMPAGSTPTPTTTPTACLAGATGCFEIPLATTASTNTWNMIGYPFAVTRSLGDARVTTTDPTNCTTGTGCDLDIAHTNSFVENIAHTYNGVSGTYNTFTTSDDLSPWKGYWTQTLQSAEMVPPVNLLIPTD